MDLRLDHPAKTIHHLELSAQAFQSWNEKFGEARPKPSVLLRGIQSGGKQRKPQCAKSPQFLSSPDRFQTSYSVHPSTSFAIVYPGFVTTALLFCLSEMGESVCFVFCAEHAVCAVCAVCTQCAKPHYGSFTIPGGTGNSRQPH